MKPELVKRDGRVFELADVQLEQTYLNPKYDLFKQDIAVLSPTGWLSILHLTPISGTGPSFVGRWDGASRAVGKTPKYDLDFDIESVYEKERDQFINGKNGYSGHHSTKVASWRHEVYISTPRGTIFKGSVCFHLHHQIEC